MRLRKAGFTIAVLLLPAAVSCGGRTLNPTSTAADVAVERDSTLHDQLPEEVRSRGRLTVATDATYPPIEFTSDGGRTFQGFDIDLSKALAAKLGIELRITNAQFDGILAGINAGRFDFAISGMTDNRKREKQNTFVTYFKAGTAIGVKKGNPKGIRGQEDLCGLRVAALKGTYQVDTLTATTASDGSPTVRGRCLSAGRPAPIGVFLADQNTINQALLGGRVDAFMSDSPILDYQATLNTRVLEQAGSITDAQPWGIAFPKGSPLAPVFQRAMTALMQDGTYARLLQTWKLQQGGVARAEIDAAVR